MYYVRKLSKISSLNRIKCTDKTVVPDEVSADLLKEFNTHDNTLSFWQCENLTDINETLKAIIFSGNKIENLQFIVFNDNDFTNYHIGITPCDGKTGYRNFEKKHIDIINLTYKKIGSLLLLLKNISEQSNFLPYKDRNEIKNYIKEAYTQNLVDEQKLNQDLLNDIKKYQLSNQ